MALTNHIVPDSPTNNFATLNPLASFASSHSRLTISNGNLKGDVSTTADNYGLGFSTLQLPQSGKFYAEVLVTYDGVGNLLTFGCVSPTSYVPTSNSFAIYSNSTFTGILLDQYNETVRSVVNGSLGTSVSFSRTTTILGILFDIDNSSMTGWYNNNQLAIASSGIAYDNYILAIESASHASNRSDFICNFGQDPTFGGNKTSGSADAPDAKGIGKFYYDPPTGALALCTANLPSYPDLPIDPALDDLPEDYFKAVKYTGQTTVDAGTWDNVNSRSTIAVGFQADLLWLKGRNYGEHHALVDSVRGASSLLQSNRVNGESATTQHVLSIGSTNFTIGTNHEVNNANSTFVAWCWKAGGAPDLTSIPTKPFAKDNVQYQTLSAAGITAGTITPTAMSVNTKAGFSIVKWLGNDTNNSTIPHGLTKEPDFVIIKNLIDSTVWLVKLNPNTISAVSNEQQYLYLNLPNNFGTNTGEETQITTNTIKFVGDSLNNSNGSGDDMIAYCWHSVAGYSAFGSWVGTGNGGGAFVYTGFKPAFILCKNADNSGAWWLIKDSPRSPYNPSQANLYPNDAASEGSGDPIDFLSNGFKIRGTGSGIDGSGQKIIYAAFAEQPFKYATAR